MLIEDLTIDQVSAALREFLAENEHKQKKPFQVAVVCGNGRVTAGLIKAQLKKVLDSSVKIVLYADEAVDEDVLSDYDIVLSTITLPCRCSRPVIYINEIFNERELMRKIEKAKYWDDVEVPVLDNNWFVMTDLLDETRFFILQGAASYDEALQKMTASLITDGQVDDGFLALHNSPKLHRLLHLGRHTFPAHLANPFSQLSDFTLFHMIYLHKNRQS